MDSLSDVALVPILLNVVLPSFTLQLGLPKEPKRKYSTAVHARIRLVLRHLTLIFFVKCRGHDCLSHNVMNVLIVWLIK